jgi:hypothetical protein
MSVIARDFELFLESFAVAAGQWSRVMFRSHLSRLCRAADFAKRLGDAEGARADL